jgi:hypothetical protein
MAHMGNGKPDVEMARLLARHSKARLRASASKWSWSRFGWGGWSNRGASFAPESGDPTGSTDGLPHNDDSKA